jgi:PPM family protein phosphatase
MAAETAAAQLLIGQSQAQGGRNNMEDRLAVRPVRTGGGLSLLVAMIADGIGGSNCGEVAAQMSLDIVFEEIERAAVSDPNQVPRLLARALKRANDAVFEAARADKTKDGMGTTAAVVAVNENRLYLANVGDSRIYLIRNGRLQQLTVDHTWEREMVRLGHLTPEDAAVHPKAEALVRSIGYSDHLDVDLGLYLNGDDVEERAQLQQGLALQQNDRLLLCSDGLIKERHTGQGHYVETDEIVRLITRHAPEKASKALVKKAVSRQVDDNVSTIVLETAGSQRVGRSVWPLLGGSGLLAVIVVALLLVYPMWNGTAPAAAPVTSAPSMATQAEQVMVVEETAVATPITAINAEPFFLTVAGDSEGLYLDGNQAEIDGNQLQLIRGQPLDYRGGSSVQLVLPGGIDVYLDQNTKIEITAVTVGDSQTVINLIEGIILVNARVGEVRIRSGDNEVWIEKHIVVVEAMGFQVSCLSKREANLNESDGHCLLPGFGPNLRLGQFARITDDNGWSEPQSIAVDQYKLFEQLAPDIVPSPTPTPPPTSTPTASPTNTPRPTLTPTPTATATPTPTLTPIADPPPDPPPDLTKTATPPPPPPAPTPPP